MGQLVISLDRHIISNYANITDQYAMIYSFKGSVIQDLNMGWWVSRSVGLPVITSLKVGKFHFHAPS